MNRVYLAPPALLADPLTAPRAREWHALHLTPFIAVLVVDWDEGLSESDFDAKPGVVALPSLLDATPLPPAVVTALSGVGAVDGDTALGVLRRLRRVWSAARERF